MLQRLSLPHVPGPQNPASPHIIPTTVLCPSSLPSPPAAIACIRGHARKVMFFFFSPFLPSLHPPPRLPTPASLPHNPHPRALPLKPRKSCCRHGLHSRAR